MTEINLLKKLKEFWTEGDSGNQEWRNRAKNSFKFYKGDQWDSDDVSKLKSEGRPYLTFNHIFPIINLLSGFQRQNRQDIKVYPRKGGIRTIAEVLTELCKHAQDTSNGDYEHSMCFYDGIIGGKGWLGLDVSYQHDPLNGDIVIERLSPFDIIEDPNAKEYDLNKSAKFIIRPFWWDKDECVLNYPKKKTEILGEENLGLESDSPEISSVETDTYQENQNAVVDIPKKFRYRVKEYWWKSYERRKFLINVATLEAKRIDSSKEDLTEALMRRKPTAEFDPRIYRIKERVIPTLHCTTTVGSIILEDIENPFGEITLFPFFRFCPYWIDGKVMGVVDNLKDPQQEINKRVSQTLHHLNQSANSGWVMDKGAVDDKSVLEDFGSKPGVVIEKNPGKELTRLIPTPLSEGHLRLAGLGAENLKVISGVNADLLGQRPERQESGVAMELRHRQGATTSEIVFDNFNYTQQIFNQALVELIRKTNVYSEEEIKAVVDESKLDVDLAVLGSLKVGRYGIKISQSPNMPTTRMANFQAILEAVKSGLPIDPEFVIELSDLPNKEAILADLKAKKQQAMAMQPPPGA